MMSSEYKKTTKKPTRQSKNILKEQKATTKKVKEISKHQRAANLQNTPFENNKINEQFGIIVDEQDSQQRKFNEPGSDKICSSNLQISPFENNKTNEQFDLMPDGDKSCFSFMNNDGSKEENDQSQWKMKRELKWENPDSPEEDKGFKFLRFLNFDQKNWMEQEMIEPTNIRDEGKVALPVFQIDDREETQREFIFQQIRQETDNYVTSFYFNRQNLIKPFMRSILIDWMIQVSSEFQFKRNTLYLAISYLDRYLHSHNNFHTSSLQLLGVTSLFVAQKMEEIEPKHLQDFQRTTDNCCTVNQILIAEVNLIKALGYKLNTPTSIFWLNFYTSLWDDFMNEDNILEDDNKYYFRAKTDQSLKSNQQICQILDSIYIDSKFLGFNSRMIILTLMFTLMQKHYNNLSNQNQIGLINIRANQSINQGLNINILFTRYLNTKPIYLDIDTKVRLEDLELELVSQYFILPIFKDQKPNIKDLGHEDFLNQQMYNPKAIDMVKSLNQPSQQNKPR